MSSSTPTQLHAVIGGRWQSTPGDAPRVEWESFEQVGIDSRRIERGDVFWGLVGRDHNGADFAREAFLRGAAGAVVNKPVDVPENCWALTVEDPRRALWQWASWKRRQFNGTLIAVTGSVGKTTTREMIRTVLRTRLTGSASPKNYNNHVGLPLSMLRIDADHEYAVMELGASRRGEIAALAELCAPEVGVITHVGDAHLGGFGSRQAVAEAKAELLAALPPHGRVVLGSDPWLRRVAKGCRAEVTWVGHDIDCDLMATDVCSRRGELTFRVAGFRFRLPVWGRHHLTAALCAVAVGQMMDFDMDEIARALAEFKPLPMRCELIQARGATIINDTYNSNPTAMRAALELARELETSGRRIVVCGDMAELGSAAITLHRQLGKEIVTHCGADMIVACGRLAKHVVAGARAAGIPREKAVPCRDPRESIPFLDQAILPGDVVLIKGSRCLAMERLVDALREFPQRRRSA